MSLLNGYGGFDDPPSEDYQNSNIPLNYDNTDFHHISQKSSIKIPTYITPLATTFPQDTPVPVLQNVVATVSLGIPLDLKKIARFARNTEYNPARFIPVVMRIREPRTTALIFPNGKIVCTGAKSEEFCERASRKYANILQKLGFQTKFIDFKIQNIVASCDVHFHIQLEGINIVHYQFSHYEPELFPGLHYRMVTPRVTIAIFKSGKINITGAKTKKDVDDAFEQIYPILKSFKK